MKIYAKIGPIVYSRKENQSAHTTTADGTLSQGGFCATRGGCFLKIREAFLNYKINALQVSCLKWVSLNQTITRLLV